MKLIPGRMGGSKSITRELYFTLRNSIPVKTYYDVCKIGFFMYVSLSGVALFVVSENATTKNQFFNIRSVNLVTVIGRPAKKGRLL